MEHWPEQEIIPQWVHPHEGSIRRAIAPRANALTTEPHLAPRSAQSVSRTSNVQVCLLLTVFCLFHSLRILLNIYRACHRPLSVDGSSVSLQDCVNTGQSPVTAQHMNRHLVSLTVNAIEPFSQLL